MDASAPGGSGGTDAGAADLAAGDVVNPACRPAATDPACDACAKMSCCDSLAAYYAAPDYAAFETCFGPCTQQACLDMCVSRYPQAGAAYKVAADCAGSVCRDVCG